MTSMRNSGEVQMMPDYPTEIQREIDLNHHNGRFFERRSTANHSHR